MKTVTILVLAMLLFGFQSNFAKSPETIEIVINQKVIEKYQRYMADSTMNAEIVTFRGLAFEKTTTVFHAYANNLIETTATDDAATLLKQQEKLALESVYKKKPEFKYSPERYRFFGMNY